MKLVFEEQFLNEKLDENIWGFDLGDLKVNEELQIYTKDNYIIEDGILKIFADKKNSQFYSSRIKTYPSFSYTYGYIEVVAKLPAGLGSWPAIWMLPNAIYNSDPWPHCGEIDIVEHAGRELDKLHFTLHSQTYNHTNNTQKSIVKYINNVTTQFNKYACDWSAKGVTFLVNDEVVAKFDKDSYEDQTDNGWPFDQPFHLILNLAVGGLFGGKEIDDSALPFVMEVESVKIFKGEDNEIIDA